MKALSIVTAFALLTFAATAQKVYFTYLQSDNSTPFYVKLGGKTYSSSGSYLIMPNLRDSNYTFVIGYPEKSTEAKFNVAINGGDRGFLLKDFDKSPGLFDMQSMAVTRPLTDAASSVVYQTKNDPFTKMLSKAANDSSLLKVAIKPEPVPEPKKEVTVEKPKTPVQQEVKQETPVITQANTNEPPVRPAEQNTVARSVITKYSESSTNEGYGLVYFDNGGGLSDTIRLIIPNPAKLAAIEETPVKKEEQQVSPQMIKPADLPKPDAGKEERTIAKKQAGETIADAVAVKPVAACTAIANDDDFFRLRKNLAGKSKEEDMIGEAKKYFRNKCFSTEQVKNLSTLFLTAEGKYSFFDAAYNHITDRDKFASLGAELKDEYYLNRFNAMIR